MNSSKKAAAWDPFAEGRKVTAAMKEDDGGAYDRREAPALLGISVQTLHSRAMSRQLIAWKDDAGRFRFPRWQFSEGGLFPGIHECLDEFHGQDEWAVMCFFLFESEYLRKRRPLDLLRAGNLRDPLELARSQSISV